MQGFLKPYQVDDIKKKYSIGTRIAVDSMEHGRHFPKDLTGVVDFVDSWGRLHIVRDNGHTLTVIPSTDNFHILPPHTALTNKGEFHYGKSRFIC